MVFSRPLVGPDPNDVRFSPGESTSLAFAVWDGDNQEVGARKQLSSWVVMEVAVVVATSEPTKVAPLTPTPTPTRRLVAEPQEGTRSGDVVGLLLLSVVATAIVTMLVTRGMQRT